MPGTGVKTHVYLFLIADHNRTDIRSVPGRILGLRATPRKVTKSVVVLGFDAGRSEGGWRVVGGKSIHVYRAPPKCIHTLTTGNTVSKMKCIFINTALIIFQSVCIHFFGGGGPIHNTSKMVNAMKKNKSGHSCGEWELV